MSEAIKIINELLDAMDREEKIINAEKQKDWKHLTCLDGQKHTLRRVRCGLKTMLKKYEESQQK